MNSEDNMSSNANEGPRPVADVKRVLMESGLLALGGAALYLLLIHVVFPHRSAGQSDLIACVVFLLSALPFFVLIQRHAAMAESRRRLERANETESPMLRAVIDRLPDLIYVKDTESRFLLANPAQRKFVTGNPETQLIGKTDFDFFAQDSATAFFNDEQTIIRTGEPLVSQAELALDSEGREVWLLTTKVPFRRDDGTVAGIIGIGRNVTAQKQIEAEVIKAQMHAEAANRAKSEFLANMSHEIRTPLNGVIGMTELALETELTDEQREYLETVKLSAGSLLNVINDILDFSKIEAGKIEIEAIYFDLRECVETTLKTQALRAEEKGLELLCDVSQEVPQTIRGDSTRLRQIILNLVGNAIKFTNKGQVAVRVEVEPGPGEERVLHFIVADTGIGVLKDKQELIFESFAQADSSTTRQFGGTGLGLTITARLVAMMGGKVWVESEAGDGSEFHFTVRVGIGETKVLQAEADLPYELMRGVRVLVVDDNQTNRLILERMLARWEMRPKCVESGEMALDELMSARAAGEPYRLILTDMHMPDMDGFSLVEQIRGRLEIATATVMMLSSGAQRGETARCRELGLSGYLTKPIRQNELRDAIVRSLDRRGRQDPFKGQPTLVDSPTSKTFAALRVLLAEDNAVNQRLATRLLEKRGHQVTLAGNGQEALDLLERGSFELVLMDVQMPVIDGLEATKIIREREKGTGIRQPIVALTAHAVKGDLERCIEAGMDAYLAKPIRPEELDVMLQTYMARLVREEKKE